MSLSLCSRHLQLQLNFEGSGYSSGSGWKVIHAIHLVRPRDTIVSDKYNTWVNKSTLESIRWSKMEGFIITNKVYI